MQKVGWFRSTTFTGNLPPHISKLYALEGNFALHTIVLFYFIFIFFNIIQLRIHSANMLLLYEYRGFFFFAAAHFKYHVFFNQQTIFYRQQ